MPTRKPIENKKPVKKTAKFPEQRKKLNNATDEWQLQYDALNVAIEEEIKSLTIGTLTLTLQVSELGAITIKTSCGEVITWEQSQELLTWLRKIHK